MNYERSATLGGVQYTVRAVSEAGAIMTFGLKADNDDQAQVIALERLPWSPKTITVQPLLAPDGSRGSV